MTRSTTIGLNISAISKAKENLLSPVSTLVYRLTILEFKLCFVAIAMTSVLTHLQEVCFFSLE